MERFKAIQKCDLGKITWALFGMHNTKMPRRKPGNTPIEDNQLGIERFAENLIDSQQK